MSLIDRMQAGAGRRPPEPGAAGPAVAEPKPPAEARAPAEAKRRSGPAADPWAAAKTAIHDELVEKHADELDITDRRAVRTKIAYLVDEYVRSHALGLSRLDYDRLTDSLLDDVLGLGPLQPLIEDAEISEIMINHPRQVFIEREGRILESPVVFEGTDQLRLVIARIVSSVGRRVDESSPMCDARLRDGSRVNVIIPPLAIDGPCMTIRKFSRDKLRPADLLARGSASAAMLDYLAAAVRANLNILISGGTGSGKTTLLNILSGFIPSDERIVTIEDAAELQLQQRHVIRLEARPPNVEGQGEVVIRDLVRNALRMRPDRIVVGECRGGEALDMLLAMSTGHEGSMSTIHATSPKDAVNRLETMVLMAGTDLPSRAILKQIASAIDVVVQTQRLRGGTRRIVAVSEVERLVDGDIEFRELFAFRATGVDGTGAATGFHTATGAETVFHERFRAAGEALPPAMFVRESAAGW